MTEVCEVCRGMPTHVYVDQFYLRRKRLLTGWSKPQGMTMEFRLCETCADDLSKKLGEADHGWWDTAPGTQRFSWRTMWRKEWMEPPT